MVSLFECVCNLGVNFGIDEFVNVFFIYYFILVIVNFSCVEKVYCYLVWLFVCFVFFL